MFDEMPPGFTKVEIGGKLYLQLPCRCRFPAVEALEPEHVFGIILDPESAERGFRERLVKLAEKHVCKK